MRVMTRCLPVYTPLLSALVLFACGGGRGGAEPGAAPSGDPRGGREMNEADDESHRPAMKPAAELRYDDPADDPTRHRTDEPDPAGEARRARSAAVLGEAGFHFAEALPTTLHRAGIGGRLRPAEDVARRLMALHALNLWVYAERMSDEKILGYVRTNGLRQAMTADERVMLAESREGVTERHGGHMGWTQENMWPLAWALGFEMRPEPTAPLVDGSVVGPMLDFLPGVDGRLADFVARATPRSEAEVLDLEDLFYAAHNAARSAQLGHVDMVPAGFDPIRQGGAVHERRHGLTWMISPGVAWDETDLST